MEDAKTMTVRVTDLLKGDILTATKGVVTHSPYTSVACPKGKIHLGVNNVLKTWNKSTTVKIERA